MPQEFVTTPLGPYRFTDCFNAKSEISSPRMNILSFCWLAFNFVITLAVVFGLVCWWRSGRRFPRWVHRLALALGAVGALAASTLAITAGLSWVEAAACLLIPPLAVYLGWLWMGGPLLEEALRFPAARARR